MIVYQEQKDFTVDPPVVSGYNVGNMTIPNDPANRHYRQLLSEVEAGEAEIIPAPEPLEEEQPLTLEERVAAIEALLAI